jgi:amino acid adenylation domain-containing protein
MVWEYATDLFDAASASRITRQYVTCLRSLLGDPARRLADLPMSDDDEVRALTAAGVGPRTPYPEHATIADLFERQARDRPDAIAVREGGRTVTYAGLDARASALARRLRLRGVGLDDVIACALPRGIDAVVALLAIAKSDAAYLPVSPADPAARLTRLLANARARFVLADVSAAPALVESGVPVIAFDEAAETPSTPVEPSERRSTGASLAAIMYTSGSTGEPKGVEVLHRGMTRLLFGVDYVTLDASQKILHLAPLSFDASTFEIWSALLHGGELVIPTGDPPSAAAIGAEIRRHGVTTMWLTASLFNAIIEQECDALSPLTQLIVGGERLSVPHIRRALAQLPRTRLVNGYGPTENTTFSTTYVVPGSFRGRTSLPIGRPLANSTAFVLDARGELAVGGTVGELHVGGDGLARGYRGDLVATSAAFVDHPRFGRLYRTGDLARVRADGEIEFRGRLDDQVKLRGFRIEPAEIEAAVLRHPGVAQAAARVLPDPAGGVSLVACVVPQRDAPLSAEALAAALAFELPAHLVPARFAIVDDLPRLATGKLDLEALARIAAHAHAPSPARAEAESALEGVLCEAFGDALGLRRVAADEDFFKAGGHSLLAFRLLAKLESMLGQSIAPSMLLRHPTPRAFARALFARGDGRGADDRSSPIVPVSAGDRVLFFVPGGDGGDHALGVYARLALYLPGIAFVGFRAYGPDGRLVAPSVEALAARYIDAMRSRQAHGPYDLAGGCIGGIVAFEVARQLEAAGETVRTLTLLDTIHPTPRRRLRQRVRGWSSRIRRSLYEFLERHDRIFSPQARFDWYQRVSLRLPFPEADASRFVLDEWIRFGDMLLRSRPGRVRARTSLLMSQEFIHTDVPDRWRARTQHLRVDQLPGTHWTYIRDHVAKVAVAVRAVLEIDGGGR